MELKKNPFLVPYCFHPILFSDDANLTSSLCSFDEEQNTPDRIVSLSQVINNEPKGMRRWLEFNKLLLNVKKTKNMIFITTDEI